MSNLKVTNLISRCRKSFESGVTKNIAFRKQQLLGLMRLVNENEKLICSAAKSDLGRNEKDTWAMEIVIANNEIVEALDNLNKWASDEYQKKELLQAFSSLYIRKEPYGVCLIMSAYNYPFSLLINPLVAAIAAGNCAVLKTSESAPATAQLLLNLLPRYIDPNCYPVININGQESAQMLKDNRFDMIFFTGGTFVGRLVMKAAAENLTPVVLELGGKNPCFVDSDCDVSLAAKRICYAKYSNAGQICLSPDFVLVDKKVQDEFVNSLQGWVKKFYGDEPQKSSSFARIINETQVNRLKALIDSCKNKVAFGGQVDIKDKYVAPTVVCDPDESSDIMKQEMFGPILIVIGVDTIDEGIDIALKHEKPLALYAFSRNRTTLKRIMSKVQSGGVTLNDCVMHYLPSSLPFGGVGNSGFGSYHGKYGFDAFSHKRSVYDDGTPEAVIDIRYPPISDFKMKMIKILVKKTPRVIPQKIMNVIILVLAILGLKYFFG